MQKPEQERETVTITWEAPAEAGIGNDGNPIAITKYKLYRSETSGFALTDAGVVTKEITDAALRELEVPGLAAASTEYYFKLTAFNSIGEGSPPAEFNAFTPTDGLAFTLINTDTEYSAAKGTVSNTATAIAIPTYYEGKEVTALGADAFKGFAQLVPFSFLMGSKPLGAMHSMTAPACPMDLHSLRLLHSRTAPVWPSPACPMELHPLGILHSQTAPAWPSPAFPMELQTLGKVHSGLPRVRGNYHQ